MELPKDVLLLIRQYSKPLTRPDWRWCKWEESYCIHQTNLESLTRFKYMVPDGLYKLLSKWTLYGRLRIMKFICEQVYDHDWYVDRFELYLN